MLRFALKMLLGDRTKFIGIVLGLTFASFIITQQAGIFWGLMERTYGFITDTNQANIWVMDNEVRYVDDLKPVKGIQLYRVRGIAGIDWAVPLYKGLLRVRLRSGVFQTCNVIGIDNSTLIGGPPLMLKGNIKDLRLTDGVIVDSVGAKDKLSARYNHKNGEKMPLQIGETFEINDARANVVGICKVGRTFRSEPVIYTTLNRAINYAPAERKLVSYILVKSAPGIDPEELCARISHITRLSAYTSKQFKKMTIRYYIHNTGILLNFGFAIFLGFLIGTAIAGQTFYNFTIDHLHFFGTFRAMGATFSLLIKMVLIQALSVGLIGWGLGMGAASLFGIFTKNTDLSFKLPWQLYAGSLVAILFICFLAAFLSLIKIRRLEPAIVFKS